MDKYASSISRHSRLGIQHVSTGLLQLGERAINVFYLQADMVQALATALHETSHARIRIERLK